MSFAKRFPFRRHRGPLLEAWLLLCAAATGVGVWVAGGSAHPGTIGVTWTGTASRILQTRCVSCHGPGGDALPRLDTYDHARAASQAVKQAALTGHVPRWYAAPGFGEFVNDPTLTPHEVEMLAQWADGRAPHGDGLPPAVSRSVAATREAPAILLAVPAKHRVTEAMHTFELGPAFEDERWVRGWVFEPGNSALVTGAVVSLSSGRTIGTWAPGDGATFLPDGVALRLPARSKVRLTVHYRRPPGPAVDASRVGLYLAGAPKRELESMVLPCGAARLSRAIDALAIRPPPAWAMRSLSVVARRPDRALEPLAWFQPASPARDLRALGWKPGSPARDLCALEWKPGSPARDLCALEWKDYPASHTQTYRFRDAVALPKGTSINVDAPGGSCGVELDYVAAGERIVPRAGPAFAPLDPGALSELWCPMHADVRASMPGACSRCGMALVPMRARVEGQYWVDAALVPAALRAGVPGTLRLAVREPGGSTVVRDFETVHDRQFHLFVVSDDMREFSHVHPVAQPDGSLELPFTFTRPGAYRLYADFLPAGGTPQMVGKTVLVGGRGREGFGRSSLQLAEDQAEKTDRGMRVRFHFESGDLVAGDPSLLAFSLEDAATGLPIADLEPFLGAWGHMFILGGDLATAVHSHPTTPLSSPGGPKVYFYQRFPRAGAYRMWVQFQRGGAVATVPFTVNVVDRQRSN